MEDIEPLTSFPRMSEMLLKKGIPAVSQKQKYVASTHFVDKIAETEMIEMDEGGIFYLSPDGHRTRGYLYLLDNRGSSYPKAHICECAVLRDYRNTRFTGRFVWTNKSNVAVRVGGSYGFDGVNRLDICRSCLYALDWSRIKGFPLNTVDFVQRLEQDTADALFKTSTKKDILGRTRNWYSIRLGYLEHVDYICERCGRSFSQIDQRPFIDVITVEGSAEQRLYRNLKCLCVGCLHTLSPERFAGPFQSTIYHLYVRCYISQEKKKAIAEVMASLNGTSDLLSLLAAGVCRRQDQTR